LSLNARPHKVVEAAKWLACNGDLYKEGITSNNTCLEDNSYILLMNEDVEKRPQDGLVKVDFLFIYLLTLPDFNNVNSKTGRAFATACANYCDP
jgi:hypothetical protein